LNTSPFCSRSRFLVKVVGFQTGSSGESPTNHGTKDCSPVAPSTGAPTECRRTPAAAGRSAIAPEGSRGVLRSRKASPSCGSTRPIHRGQAPGSSSADGSEAPAPPARCTKTTRPDPQKRPACEPPTIQERGFRLKMLLGQSCRWEHRKVFIQSLHPRLREHGRVIKMSA
jgi:hypothetical protein